MSLITLAKVLLFIENNKTYRDVLRGCVVARPAFYPVRGMFIAHQRYFGHHEMSVPLYQKSKTNKNKQKQTKNFKQLKV